MRHLTDTVRDRALDFRDRVRPSRLARTTARVALLVGVAAIGFLWATHRTVHDRSPIASDATTTESASAAAEPTEASAIAAGARFATIVSELVQLPAADAKALLSKVATPEFAPVLAAQVDQELTRVQGVLASMPGQSALRQALLAVRVDSLAGGQAQVSAWVMTSLAQAGTDAPPLAVFSIQTLQVTWDGTQWRLAAASAQPGPTPLLSGQASDVSEFTTRLNGFTDWRPA